jgi:hypothetical protein
MYCETQSFYMASKAFKDTKRNVLLYPLSKMKKPMLKFIEYYTRIGVKHIFLLDNGSKDKTIELASVHENVTVFQCLLPYSMYKTALKQFLLYYCSLGNWCILADCDEFFDYPYSENIALSTLCH